MVEKIDFDKHTKMVLEIEDITLRFELSSYTIDEDAGFLNNKSYTEITGYVGSMVAFTITSHNYDTSNHEPEATITYDRHPRNEIYLKGDKAKKLIEKFL